MSSQYPYDNYPPNPEWQNNQQQSQEYSPNGYGQNHTQYEQSSYAEPTEYAQPDPYTQPNPYEQSNPYAEPVSNMYTPPSNPYGQMAQQYAPVAPGTDSRGGFAIAGLVLGILSILSSWFPICGLPLPIIGIVMAALGRRSFSHRTLATVGMVLSIIALVIGVVITAATFIAASHGSSSATPWY